jgi:hypothetical protein
MTAGSGADDSDRYAGSTVAEETTRVEAVRYLEGVSGHGVFSLLLLSVAAVLFAHGQFGSAVMAGIVAYGVAINGLSIYLWDELRRFFEASLDRSDETVTRTLVPHRISAETKAELASGAVMVGGFSVVLGITLVLLRTLGFERTALVAAGGLAVGNLGALGWTYVRP